MAMAQVVNHNQDDIVRGYEELLDELSVLEERQAFWQQTLGNSEMKRFIADLRQELAEERESWDTIKSANFPESRAQVRARRHLIGRIEDMDMADEIRAVKRKLFEYETGNELILRGAGYKLDRGAIEGEDDFEEPESLDDSDVEEGMDLDDEVQEEEKPKAKRARKS